MKYCTDKKQSKKLDEILPIESADMFYNEEPDETYPKGIVDTKYPMVLREGQKHYLEEYGIPCWSLSALIDVLPRVNIEKEICSDDTYNYRVKAYIGDGYIGDWYDNPVDACVKMIIKLHEEGKLEND